MSGVANIALKPSLNYLAHTHSRVRTFYWNINNLTLVSLCGGELIINELTKNNISDSHLGPTRITAQLDSKHLLPHRQ